MKYYKIYCAYSDPKPGDAVYYGPGGIVTEQTWHLIPAESVSEVIRSILMTHKHDVAKITIEPALDPVEAK